MEETVLKKKSLDEKIIQYFIYFSNFDISKLSKNVMKLDVLKKKMNQSFLNLFYDTFLLLSFLCVFSINYYESLIDIQFLIDQTNVPFHLDQLMESDVNYYNDPYFFQFREMINFQNIDFIYFHFVLKYIRSYIYRITKNNNNVLHSVKYVDVNTFRKIFKKFIWKIIEDKYSAYVTIQKKDYSFPSFKKIEHKFTEGVYEKEFRKIKKFLITNNENNKNEIVNEDVLQNKSNYNINNVESVNNYNVHKHKEKNGILMKKNNVDTKLVHSYFNPLNYKCQKKYQQCLVPFLNNGSNENLLMYFESLK